MRLLQLQEGGALSLVEFRGNNIPPYAILSHTWRSDNEEVNFQDVERCAYETKVGYHKLSFCGEQAKKDSLDYFWVDTCCIDKTNFTELSEAINSMFKWYRDATKCYVYLSDVNRGETSEVVRHWKPAFRKSRWFTRGWTLQELIAPKAVDFYSSDGAFLGNKQTLQQTLHEITGIPNAAFQEDLLRFNLDDRMSWLGKRETSVEEDLAYCLLGIFDIHMPLIYGEGRDHAMRRLRKEIRDHHVIELPIAEGASYNSHMEEHNTKCLPNTRTDLLQCIKEWANDNDSPSLFWLSGMAGTGKSVVARTVATHFAGQKQLGASFFFKRGEGERGTATRFFSTLAADLAACEPGMVPLIKAAQEEDPSICQKVLRDQFEKLILNPFLDIQDARSRNVPLVIIIDALDECDKEIHIRTILELLSQTHATQPISLKILVTSRPELPIRIGFKQMPDGTYQNVVLHEMSHDSIAHDLRVFVEHQVEEIRQNHLLPLDWPRTDQIQALVDLAIPLFIYAATVCRYIGTRGGDPDEYLSKILAFQKSTFSQLDRTYLPVLHQLLEEQEDDDKETWLCNFKDLVGSIVLLESPLSAPSLATLLQIPVNKIKRRMSSLHSVLSIPDDEHIPIRLLHLSFREFLIEPRKTDHHLFWVDRIRTNEKLLGQCLNLMSGPGGLRPNILGLESPGPLRSEVDERQIKANLPPPLQYSCRYWIHHLERSEIKVEDGDSVHNFLRAHLLHWIEAMSFLGELYQCIPFLKRLRALASSGSSTIANLIRDAWIFVLRFQNVLRDAPLQVYTSALTFAPEDSIVKRTFAHHAHVWTELRLGEERDWSACRINLEGNLGSVFAMAFSPNSQLLASSSRDNTIAIWDVSTGNCHSIIVEHTHPVSSLVFSPDGRLLASGSHDKTIRIWNTGTWTRKATLAGHTEAVATLAWSQDSRIVVTGSYDKTVKLWDIENGSCYATFCVYGGDCVYAVAISPDNRLVAFTSDTDGTVRIWDTTTMSCCHIINGRRAVLAIQFSSDSGIIAVAVEYYYDSICGKGCNEVNFYDVKTGRNCASFDFGTETQFVAFSSDLENVAYLENNTIILWSYSTGLCHTHLESCANFGTDIPTISPDHALVATTGVDGTIMIWDTSATPKNHNALEGNVRFQDEAVWAMTSSPDGKLFASRHVDQIKVWDSETGTCIHSFECPLAPGETRDHKIHLEFSPNSLILAYTTGNGCGSELRLHSMQSWSCCAYFDHTYHIEQVQISQDGEHIVSQSANGTIRLWKIAHGICIRVLEDKSCYKPDSILCLSQNNNFVAVGSPDDGTIDLWNVTTGFSKTLAGHMDPIENLVFSPNSQLLASNSSATRIMLWDVERASCQLIIETNVQFSTLLAFSPNSKLLASLDCTIRLWDTKTGQCRHIFPTIPRWARSVAFSPCGTYLQTNAGKLAVPASLLDRAMVTQLPPCVFVGKRWIYLNGAPVFWLPEEYRPEVMQISGTTIFLRTREDKFTIVRLDLDQLKRIYPRLFESAQEGKRTVV